MNTPDGQLLPAEREFLYRSVMAHRPAVVLEVGTWNGGGSTLQIHHALCAIEYGMLYTCETDAERFATAHAYYHDKLHIECRHQPSTDLIEDLIATGTIPDIVFFDGAEDADLTLSDFKLISEHMKPGSIFMCHDWDAPSKKAASLRPYIEVADDWDLVECLTAPVSVGMCKYVKTIYPSGK